jgi:hypothetical protein
MSIRSISLIAGTLLIMSWGRGSAQQPPARGSSTPSVVQARLIAPGSRPFHLKATITAKDDPGSNATVEMFWVAPNKWRRTIESQDFSQTLVVNGDKVIERDSEDYFPLALQTLVTAMVDPSPALQALRPGDRLLTKANGASEESGVTCFPNQTGSSTAFCGKGPYGLNETVRSPGHPVDFTDYQSFQGRRVARRVSTSPEPGVVFLAQVTELSRLKHPDAKLFSIAQPTPKESRITIASLPETELLGLSLETHKIIWPQVLDGRNAGTATYFVSVDRSGQVRETVPLHSDNERANDSARRQIMKWKFKPAIRDGLPVQVESILTFDLDTRAWGPPSPLSNAEARKLASDIVEPVFPPGTAPEGAIYTLMAAIDSDGTVIEVIPGGGPPGLFSSCYHALSQWHFSPILQDGEPRPYRAQIDFVVH